jgi:hypothetical protein
MSFEFKKPEISWKKMIAMMLAVVLSVGQLSLPASAAGEEGNDNSSYEEVVTGDVTGDAYGTATIVGYRYDMATKEDESYHVQIAPGDDLYLNISFDYKDKDGNTFEIEDGENATVQYSWTKDESKLSETSESYNIYYEGSDMEDTPFGTYVCDIEVTIGEQVMKDQVTFVVETATTETLRFGVSNATNNSIIKAEEGKPVTFAIQVLTQSYDTKSGEWKDALTPDDVTYTWSTVMPEGEYDEISGEKGSSYTISSVTKEDFEKSFKCDVNYQSKCIGSEDFYVIDKNDLTNVVMVTSNEYSFNIPVGKKVALVTKVVDRDDDDKLMDASLFTYQWYRIEDSDEETEVPLSGETKSVYQLTVKAEDFGDYKCYVYDNGKEIGATNFTISVDDEDYEDDGQNHDWTVTELRAASCNSVGYCMKKCDNCGETEVEEIPTIAHTWDSGKVTTAATCGKAGVKTYTCSVCNSTKTEAIPATGNHSYSNWTVVKEATALAEGSEERTCSVCGNKETRSIAKIAATISLNCGKTVPLKVKQSTTAVKVTYSKGDSIKSWKSSNAKVATVTNKGKITAKKAGKATITVTLKSGKKASFTVKVQKAAVTTTKVTVASKSVSLKKGKTAQIKATVTPVTSSQKVTYKTSNKKVATVTNKGKITAKKKGSATITVTSGKKTAKVKVKVK